MISTIQRNLRAYMDKKTTEERARLNSPRDQCTGMKSMVLASVEEQEEIGWKHFFAGRLSKKWQEALEKDHEIRVLLNPTARITPISSFIRTLWESSLTLWRQ